MGSWFASVASKFVTAKALCRAAALVALAMPADAFGHGGAYRGPGGGGPGTGGGGPGTGGGLGGGPPTPGGRGPSTGGAGALMAAKKVTPSYTDFATWWDLNKHRHLNLRARLRSRTALTGNAVRSRDLSGRPTFQELQGETLDGLLRLVKDPDVDIADSALLAVARITPAEHASLVRDALLEGLKREEASARNAAILALGVLGSTDSVDLLLDVLADRVAGRRALKLNESVSTHARGLAAVSLGLIGDARAIAPLIAAFRDERDGDDELRCSVILALGLFRDPPHDITQFLVATLEEDGWSDLVRAQIPIALHRGRESSRVALPALLKLAKGKKTPNHVRQSAVIACGELADPTDAAVIEELLDVAESATDDASSNFAFLGLGTIGARAAADRDLHAECAKQVQRALLKGLVRPRERSHVPWAAMALALSGKEMARDSLERDEIEKRLGDAFVGAKSNDHRAAIAIAIGLLEAQEHGKALLSEFLETNDTEYASSLAEALGLMRYDAATKALRERLEKTNDAKLRARVAIGLGLMGDLEVAGALVDELAKTNTLYGTATIAKSIGIVGDRSAVAPLAAIAHAKGRASLVSAFAVVSLGLLGEKTPLPWNVRIMENANYIATFVVKREVLDIL